MKQEIIHLEQYSITPDRKDISQRFAALINELPQDIPLTLQFEKGIYRFDYDTSIKLPYYISNTASEKENFDVTKTIGILLQNTKNITLDGNGSTFLFYGKSTQFVIDKCENIVIKNCCVDFIRPTVSEFEVLDADYYRAVIRIHPDSWYEIKKNKLVFTGPEGNYGSGECWVQQYSKSEDKTVRLPLNVNDFKCQRWAKEVGEREIEIKFSKKHHFKADHIYQFRNVVRDNVGTFINNSENVKLIKNEYRFMHGLGIVGQMSKNIAIENCRFAPDEQSGRTTCAFADFMHFSGCRGSIEVKNNFFNGAHDDLINVHGTHLKIVGIKNKKEMTLRFKHRQTYGFNAFCEDDEIIFINPFTLLDIESNKIVSSRVISPREIAIELEKPISSAVKRGIFVENVSACAELLLENNHAKNIPTRGVLFTSRAKADINNNVFEKMGMSGILLSDDAHLWYESGCVRNVSIKNNTFIECGSPVFKVYPENIIKVANRYVHKNVTIESNKIILENKSNILVAKCTDDISFVRNEIESKNERKSNIRILHCKNVTLEGNFGSYKEKTIFKK